MRRLFRLLLLIACLPLLSACENDGIAFLIAGKDHSISLLREQRWFWNDEVTQSIVVTRMPVCQRRFELRPGTAGSVKIEVYEAGDLLWAFKQGKYWYLVSTERCQFQRWDDAPADPPGALVGTFQRKNGELTFVRANTQAIQDKAAGE
ncbi:MAG: hypothetical protein HGA47_06580 [Zoogloea sp.]|nr:hypothetical protein [Zoogloea sp.]